VTATLDLGRPQARLIANPAAGAGRPGAAFHAATGVLAASGWTVSVQWTEAAGTAAALARQAAAEGVDVVVAAGGDGTVNEVANGLVGSRTALAVLPLGTGNVLAAQLGLVGVPTPLHRPDPAAAAAALVQGQVLTVDTGLATGRHGPGRHFVLWAGVGFDAAIAHELEGAGRDLKARFGPFAYGALGLRAMLATRGTAARVRLDRRRIQGRLLMAVVANIALYAGSVELTPEARLDDGRLDVALFLGASLRQAAAHLGAVLLGRSGPAPDRVAGPAQRVRILARRHLPVHVDAEPFGTTPVRFDVVPASLRLVVPPTAPDRLFAGRAG
jgi:YegS/Rv2252/BmrU family lipid kinase